MAVWQCRVLLVVVLCHLALSSPAVRRDLRGLAYEPPQDPLALAQPAKLGEETFGGAADPRGGREKRLLKTVGVVKSVKAVATKAAVAGAKAIGAKVLKSSAGVAAGALGLKAVAGKAIGAKVKAVGVKAIGTVAALGLKALLLKFLFGLSKSSLQSVSQPRQRPVSTPTPGSEDDEVPQFDPNKISLQVPDELFAPAFNSVNSISTILGNLIQNTAERVAGLVERLKPLLRSSLGFRSRKRETEEDKDTEDTNDLADNETTFFTDSDSSANEVQQLAGSETQTQTAASAEEELNSPIKTSYAALANNR
ncbi:uncharacterized protein LOC128989589 isoform X2 [Macrosteles quadrilineatus]|nr:uncharacterized protein LOC128989589 isoform X2 [Macrosteles quadrilineatus]